MGVSWSRVQSADGSRQALRAPTVASSSRALDSVSCASAASECLLAS